MGFCLGDSHQESFYLYSPRIVFWGWFGVGLWKS